MPFQGQQQHWKASTNVSNTGGAEKESIFFCGAVTIQEKDPSWCPFWLYRFPTESKEGKGDEPSESPITTLVQSETLPAFCKWIFVRACLRAIIESFCGNVLLFWCTFWACLIYLSPHRAPWKKELFLLPLPQPPLWQAEVCPPARRLEHTLIDSHSVMVRTPVHIPSLQRRPDWGGGIHHRKRGKGHQINKAVGKKKKWLSNPRLKCLVG